VEKGNILLYTAFMVKRDAVINNNAGIHVRPSGVIMKEVSSFKGTVTIQRGGSSTELNNIMALLSLGLLHGDNITIQVEGPEEEEEADRLVELFEYNFDFPGREDK
jgi:phosphocarrier protein HPr